MITTAEKQQLYWLTVWI